jgi:hypothetical protein
MTPRRIFLQTVKFAARWFSRESGGKLFSVDSKTKGRGAAEAGPYMGPKLAAWTLFRFLSSPSIQR